MIVDSTMGLNMLGFINAYSWFNQIHLNPINEKMTTFITNCGLYYYQVISVGLKNVITTFQRLVNKMFKD